MYLKRILVCLFTHFSLYLVCIKTTKIFYVLDQWEYLIYTMVILWTIN
jgi:hypothetical protein